MSVGALNAGAGAGVFVTPQVAIGVRALAASSGATELEYAPTAAGTVGVRATLSHEAIILDAARHGRVAGLISGFGIGVGRVDLAVNDSSHATYGPVFDLQLVRALARGITASVEITLIGTSSTASGPTKQLDVAFLIGWQHL